MSRTVNRALLAVVIALGAAAPRDSVAQPASPAAPGAAPAAPATGKAAAKPADAKPANKKPGEQSGNEKPANEKPGAQSGNEKPADVAPDAGAPAGDAGALPQGHPPVEALPSGHPSVEPNPHGARPSPGEPDVFVPPPDGAEDDPSLPAGVLVVSVRDAGDRPLPGAPIRLEIVHSSVAKGETREERTATAGPDGSARFEGLGVGSGINYHVITARGPAVFSPAPFQLGDQAGKRAVVHSYEMSTDLDDVFVLMQGYIYVALREGNIVVEQGYTIGNLGPIAWVPDVTIPLPAGYKALNRSDSPDEVRLDEAPNVGVAIRGTVSPGRHDLSFRYHVPLETDAAQSLRIDLPPRMMQARVYFEGSKTMGLQVDGFPTAQRTTFPNGAKGLMTEQRATRVTGLQSVSVTLSGLPTPPPGRWVALGIAAAAVLGAVAFIFRKPEGEREVDADAQRELIEARDALLDEFVELERARKRGDVGPKSYARVRDALLDALARITGMIEQAAAAAPRSTSVKAGKADRAGKPSRAEPGRAAGKAARRDERARSAGERGERGERAERGAPRADRS